eukprot:1159756-Pelagomonas_calceolata.AAC.14
MQGSATRGAGLKSYYICGMNNMSDSPPGSALSEGSTEEVHLLSRPAKKLTICEFLRLCASYTLAFVLHSSPPSISSSEESRALPVPAPVASCPTCLITVPPPALSSLAELQLLLPDVRVMQVHADTHLPESLDGEQLNPHYLGGM